MVVTGSDISRSTQMAWKAVFGRPLSSSSASPRTKRGEPLLIARVKILGTPMSSVLIICPLEEARRTAAAFYSKDPAALEQALVEDVFGELANMIGGQIKRHFPSSSRLSLPEIDRAGADAAAEGSTVAEAVFECGRGPLSVRLVQNPS